MSDKTLKQTVLEELAWEPSVNAAHICVTVRDGVVTLLGHVGSYAAKCAAARCVETLAGVKGVSNSIEIWPNVEASDMRAKISTAFGRNSGIDADMNTIVTDGGKVAISGEFESLYERYLAARTAWSAPGVTRVEDKMIVA